MRVLAVAACLLLAVYNSVSFAGSKLIHYGWDNPAVSQLPAVIPKFKTSVFDGISVRATAFENVFAATARTEADIAGDLAVLNRVDRKRLANSYILVQSATDDVFDWSNDAHWAATIKNMRLLARLAKRGGFKGIVFDMEPYQKSPWDYSTQPSTPRLGYGATAALVRSRGKAFIEAIQQEFPGVEIWCLYGLTANSFDLEEVNAGRPMAAVLAGSGYGLWPSFFTGWIEGAKGATSIIDGNEPAYYYTRRFQFREAKKAIRDTYATFIQPGSRARYQSVIKIGHAVYVDGVANLHKSPRFIGYYFETQADRNRLLYSNTLNALRSSESLVWVYGENAKWWQSPPPPGIDAALRRAKKDAAAGVASPAPSAALKAAEAGLRNRITIGGAFTDANGQAFKPESFGSAVNNAACSTWGDKGQYGCDFPRGATVVITPTINGKTVTPPSRSYTNLGQTDWSTNWTVQ